MTWPTLAGIALVCCAVSFAALYLALTIGARIRDALWKEQPWEQAAREHLAAAHAHCDSIKRRKLEMAEKTAANPNGLDIGTPDDKRPVLLAGKTCFISPTPDGRVRFVHAGGGRVELPRELSAAEALEIGVALQDAGKLALIRLTERAE